MVDEPPDDLDDTLVRIRVPARRHFIETMTDIEFYVWLCDQAIRCHLVAPSWRNGLFERLYQKEERWHIIAELAQLCVECQYSHELMMSALEESMDE